VNVDRGRAEMRWYSVQIAVVGSPPEVLKEAVPAIQEELEARAYLRRPRASWDAGRGWLFVQVEDELEDSMFETAELRLHDDLSDVVSACSVDWEDFDLHVLDVTEV